MYLAAYFSKEMGEFGLMKKLHLWNRKMWVIALQIAILAAGFLPLASQADTVTQEIRVSDRNMAGTVSINPATDTSTIGPNLAFHVVNDTDKPVNFNIPKLGISYYIPANMQPTFFITVAPYMDPQIAYQIQDTAGNQLALGTIINESAQSQVATSGAGTSMSKYESTTTTTTSTQPVHRYSEAKTIHHHAHKMIRGYW